MMKNIIITILLILSILLGYLVLDTKGSYSKNNLKSNNHIDTVVINDSTRIVYEYEKGLIIQMSTLFDGETEIQKIIFHDNSQLKFYSTSRFAHKPPVFDNEGDGYYLYYSQRINLDSLGDLTYCRLNHNFNLILDTSLKDGQKSLIGTNR